MEINFREVHTIGTRSDGTKGIIRKDPYKVFISSGQPKIFLYRGRFLYEDGVEIDPGEQGEKLPSYVQAALPKDFWDKKEESASALAGLPTEALARELERRMAEVEAAKPKIQSSNPPLTEAEVQELADETLNAQGDDAA